MIIYVKNTYKPMRKSKKCVDVSKRPSKVKIVPMQTHFNPVVSGVLHRETPNYPSLSTNDGSTTKSQRNVYTGDNMIGIGTLHKSNAVPIFKKEDMEDQAKMRR
jgi:hypothetical protein